MLTTSCAQMLLIINLYIYTCTTIEGVFPSPSASRIPVNFELESSFSLFRLFNTLSTLHVT